MSISSIGSILRGIVGRHLGLGRAESAKVGARGPEAVVVGEGWAVAPGEAVGGRRGGDGCAGKAISDIQYVGFYPQMGWFVTNWLELYGRAEFGSSFGYLPYRAAVKGDDEDEGLYTLA
jgi:hypothetical protein